MTTVNKQQYPEAMADDLDELLDEVETKFCRNVYLTPQLQAPSDLSTAGKCLTQTGKERKHWCVVKCKCQPANVNDS